MTTPRLLCPRCLAFLPESASGIVLLPPAPPPLRSLWCPGRRMDVILSLDTWHPTIGGVPSMPARATFEGVTLYYDSGPVRVPRWLGEPSMSVRSA